MHYLIQVSKDSPTWTVNETFDHAIVDVDSCSDYTKVLCSDIIRKELGDFNRKNIFSPESFSVYEDNFYYACAICDGGYYSYTFSCYLFFTKSSEVIDFQNSFSSDAAIQFKLHLALQDVISKFSFDPSFEISAIEVCDMIEHLVSVNHNLNN